MLCHLQLILPIIIVILAAVLFAEGQTASAGFGLVAGLGLLIFRGRLGGRWFR